MIEVHPGLFVGSQESFFKMPSEDGEYPGWAIIHACKEPYHRQFVGYLGRAAPIGDPEYLFARRGWRLAMNLVDVQYPEYIKPVLVDYAMAFIRAAQDDSRKVLIHCNQGGSRAPGLALHWLRRNDARFMKLSTFEEGEELMRDLYPLYKPAEGIRGYVREHWGDDR